MDTSLATILTGAGVAGVFCILFIAGMIFPRAVVIDLKTEVAELKQALAAERERADTAVAGASVTKDVLAAIQIGRDLGHAREPT
jgi:hypothetical protein